MRSRRMSWSPAPRTSKYFEDRRKKSLEAAEIEGNPSSMKFARDLIDCSPSKSKASFKFTRMPRFWICWGCQCQFASGSAADLHYKVWAAVVYGAVSSLLPVVAAWRLVFTSLVESRKASMSNAKTKT
eukprot:2794193-Rhodomonas_salina.2